ncbi:MAG: DMT family transporter [Agathobacter sp.]|nr:DMT family transporter [Agathobacter sp.]
MKKQNILGMLLLLIAASVWGVAFVAQSVGMNHLNAFAFNSIRNAIGVVVLLPVLATTRRINRRRKNATPEGVSSPVELEKQQPLFTRDLFIGGTLCGVALCIASNLQQLGIEHSTVGKSAFITTLYIVLVPVMGLFFKKKLSLQVWISVVLAMIGLFLLCMKNEVFVLGIGDIYLILCALFFTIQILCVDHYVQKVDGVALSIMQFFVTSVLSGIGMLFTGFPSWSDIASAAIPLLYAGAISSGVGYTLQIVGQKMLPATVASLIMSLESVIAALAGWVILHEVLSEKELLGCVLVFAAVILTQLPLENFKKLFNAHKNN